MTHTITRRAALKGVSAIAAVIAVPAVATASSAHTLAALIEHWRGLEAAIKTDGSAVDALEEHLR